MSSGCAPTNPVASVKSLNLPSLSFVIFKMWMIISLFRKQIFMELLRCAWPLTLDCWMRWSNKPGGDHTPVAVLACELLREFRETMHRTRRAAQPGHRTAGTQVIVSSILLSSVLFLLRQAKYVPTNSDAQETLRQWICVSNQESESFGTKKEKNWLGGKKS